MCFELYEKGVKIILMASRSSFARMVSRTAFDDLGKPNACLAS